jgi:hypothetical protein
MSMKVTVPLCVGVYFLGAVYLTATAQDRSIVRPFIHNLSMRPVRNAQMFELQS